MLLAREALLIQLEQLPGSVFISRCRVSQPTHLTEPFPKDNHKENIHLSFFAGPIDGIEIHFEHILEPDFKIPRKPPPTNRKSSAMLKQNYCATMSRYWPGPVRGCHLSGRKSVGGSQQPAMYVGVGDRWRMADDSHNKSGSTSAPPKHVGVGLP